MEGSDFPDVHLYTACGFSNPMASWMSLTEYPFCFSSSLMRFPVSF